MRKLLLSLIGIFAAGFMSAQTYPYVDINTLMFVDSTSLANCVDTNIYLGDTVTTRGIVLTDGDLSEVSSSSVQGGYRPFFSMVDTSNGGAQGPFKQIVVMAAFDGGSQLQPLSLVPTLKAGMEIEITGVITNFAGLVQLQPLNNNSASIVGGAPQQPTPVVISAGDIQDHNGNNVLPTGEQWEGAYVELQNVSVVSVSIFSGGSRCEFTVADANGNQVLIADRFLPMVMDSVSTVNPNSPDSIGRFTPPAIGTIYNYIRGVIFQDENGCANPTAQFAGGYEINPVFSTDFDKAAPPPQVTNIQRNPLVPNASQSVTVSADIVDLDGTVSSATLFYSADQTASTSLFQSVSMTNSGSLYSATIPAFALDSVVRYYISATDDSSLTTNTPVEFYTVRANGLSIVDIQEVPSFLSGDASPYEGDTVSVTGIVTASFQSNDLDFLYIQDENATEYAGIYVSGGPTSIFGLSRGDEVTVTGVVEENYGFTQIAATNVVATSNTGIVSPVVLDPSDANFFPSNNNLEKYESMLLRYENPTVGGKVWVANPDLGFGEYSVGSGQNASVAARILAGRAQAGSAQGSLNVSYISDTAAYGSNLNVTPIQVDTATSMDYVEGILFYAFGDYKLTPRNNADFGNIVVSIEDIRTSDVNTRLYPNPAQDRVMIQLDENYEFNQLEVEVIDLSGRVVVEQRTATHLSSINLSGLEGGMYIVKVMNQGDMIHSAKLMLK
ncbi:MAG: hypothetical protein CMC96_06095 [Flavobacteriales bacterium]|mgnify:FL=1|nr:hypothetical protein [Flavobacteriales bacterium]|tara:strand:+ start:12744 stop:14921 length:2178 start_codon:yes stop_codon:yes gene_type:complete